MTSRRRDIAQSDLRVFPSIRCIRHLGCGLWKKRKKKYSCSFNLSINVVAWGQKLHVVYKRFPTYHRQNLLGNLPGISDKSWGLLRHEETIQKTLHVKSAKNQGQQEELDETMHCGDVQFFLLSLLLLFFGTFRIWDEFFRGSYRHDADTRDNEIPGSYLLSRLLRISEKCVRVNSIFFFRSHW